MKLSLRAGILPGLIAGLVTIACTDSGAPNRSDRYDWYVVVPPDTLTFHWAGAELPVRYWVEDSAQAPALIQRGIGLWQATVGTSSYRGIVVTDSTMADVIVRVQPLSPFVSATRLYAGPGTSCEAVTAVDTASSRYEVQLPMRMDLNVTGDPMTDSAQACLSRVTAHEVGHTLGLFQHSDDPADLMFVFPEVNRPSTRDANTVITLYATPRNMVPVGP
jgi:predicted Zn-dependent protease